jgi:hypothetical protein
MAHLVARWQFTRRVGRLAVLGLAVLGGLGECAALLRARMTMQWTASRGS